MDKFYINLIPVGESKWRENIYNNIINTARYSLSYTLDEWLNDKNVCSVYSKNKMNNRLAEAKLEDIYSDEPKFFPNEPIQTDKCCMFRMVINFNITKDENKLNELVLTPWHDELVKRKDAMWVSIEKTIKDHTNYNLIICNDIEKYKEEIGRVITECYKWKKPYKVIDDNKLSFNGVLEMF